MISRASSNLVCEQRDTANHVPATFLLLVRNVGNGWEWGNGIIVDSYCGSFPHSLLSTSKFFAVAAMLGVGPWSGEIKHVFMFSSNFGRNLANLVVTYSSNIYKELYKDMICILFLNPPFSSFSPAPIISCWQDAFGLRSSPCDSAWEERWLKRVNLAL